jgi:poly(hydroxyalkanoate) depolymerase family esterase
MTFKLPRSFSRLLKSQKMYRKLLAKALRTPTRTVSRKSRSPVAAKPKLSEVTGFGSNPGRLTMKLFVPGKLPAKPPLVVVLHGCRQTPESLDTGAGFSRFATLRGFVLLYPQQNETNNPQRCFNWFRPSAVARDRGELMSVSQMIEYTCRHHRVDRSRVYVAGLSAGGAMTSALVATYPDLFAGVAIFAGMPFGAARDAISAMRGMRSGIKRDPQQWGDLVRSVSPNTKEWPPISVWHGTADSVVNPLNGRALVSQWLEAADMDKAVGRTKQMPWGTLEEWKRGDRLQLSFYSVQGLGHGLPRKFSNQKERVADAYVLPSELSAPLELMRAWGLRSWRAV